MENKKKRGSNYTPDEKLAVLELVNKYKHILENKETHAPIIWKKREAWAEVTRQFNAVNSSGTRTWQQLRHLYENLKQRSKNNRAKENSNQSHIKKIEILKTKATNDKVTQNLQDYPDYSLMLKVQDNIKVEEHSVFNDTEDYVAEVPKEKERPYKKNKASYKDQYFKKKLRNATLENRYIINKHKMEVSKYRLEIQILKLRLKKLQNIAIH